MLGTVAFTFSFLVAAADPRPVLVELQLAGRNREALARTEQELAGRPEESHRLGLDYLKGHLLHLLGRSSAAAGAFADALGLDPPLAFYAQYRLALEQSNMGHPEMAAGLVATAVRNAPPGSPLLPEAVRLLCSAIASGGDCRLIQSFSVRQLAPLERRLLQVARSDCALRSGEREMARSLLTALVEESVEDEAARAAAERLAVLVSESERGHLPRLLGLTFHRHRDFEQALRHLGRAGPGGGSAREQLEAAWAQARSLFGQERYAQAAIAFGLLAARAERAGAGDELARARFYQGRAYELLGRPDLAGASFQRAYLASPQGDWAAAALVSGLRLDWRAGNRQGALALYSLLASNFRWRAEAGRAALFLASSDLASGRRDRAGGWLAQAARGARADRIEVAYWRGRLAELEGKPLGAVAAYLEALRIDRFHPLGQAAAARLRGPALARVAAAEGRRLAVSRHTADLLDAWLLLGDTGVGDADTTGRRVRAKLVRQLAADPAAGPFLRMAPVPVAAWPLWRAPLRTPEEMLLALGIVEEGAPAVAAHFPAREPSLAFTGARMLARAGRLRLSIDLAEAVRARLPARLPVALLPREFQGLLYPLAYNQELVAQGRQRGIDPHLLAAVVREESLFDPYALSPSSARGLAQFVLPTAQRLASQLEMPPLDPDDLYRPELSIALAAAHLAALGRDFGGAPHLAATAFNAGEVQTQVWRSYCASAEPEELYTKVGFDPTRDYLRRVMTSWAQYERLY
jgi:peptidoglycan lytic transglycosylase